MSSDDLKPVANFLFEAGTLKATARTGWWMAGVRQPETVAEHSWRTSLIASIIAQMEGADPAKAALLAVWHDTGETRTGDVNHLGKKYSSGEADPEGYRRGPGRRHARSPRRGRDRHHRRL